MTFFKVPSEYREVFLASFGHQLSSIKLAKCYQFDPAAFARFTKLEELEVEFNVKAPPLTSRTANNFLPNLRKLVVNRCLCSFSPTFETFRPSLTEVRLVCAHFGNGDVSSFNWEDLPQLWPNLEHFSFIHRSNSLTLDQVREIFPQFKKLNSLCLPIYTNSFSEGVAVPSWQKGMKSTKEMRDYLVDQFWQLPSPIELSFQDNTDSLSCHFY